MPLTCLCQQLPSALKTPEGAGASLEEQQVHVAEAGSFCKVTPLPSGQGAWTWRSFSGLPFLCASSFPALKVRRKTPSFLIWKRASGGAEAWFLDLCSLCLCHWEYLDQACTWVRVWGAVMQKSHGHTQRVHISYVSAFWRHQKCRREASSLASFIEKSHFTAGDQNDKAPVIAGVLVLLCCEEASREPWCRVTRISSYSFYHSTEDS